jgi:hypothetical protein
MIIIVIVRLVGPGLAIDHEEQIAPGLHAFHQVLKAPIGVSGVMQDAETPDQVKISGKAKVFENVFLYYDELLAKFLGDLASPGKTVIGDIERNT